MTEHREFIRDTDCKSIAVLMIHGIIGTPAHFSGLIDIIPEKLTIHNILLDGHGGGVGDFARTSMKKWKEQVRAETEMLLNTHDKLFIVAHSMGTLLAIHLALETPMRIAGLFLLAVPTRPRVKLSSVIVYLRAVFGCRDEKAEKIRRSTSIKLSRNLFAYLLWIPRYLELFSEICKTRMRLSKLNVSAYVFQSYDDELVSYSSVKDVNNIRDAVIRTLYESGHFNYGENDLKLLRNELVNIIGTQKL